MFLFIVVAAVAILLQSMLETVRRQTSVTAQCKVVNCRAGQFN